MSIPGLGRIAPAPVVPTKRVHALSAFWEWRFEVPFGSNVGVKLISGTAEKDGTELALDKVYSFSGVKSKILTWHGCELEVDGTCDDEFVAEYAQAGETPMNSYLNLHFKLTGMRQHAERQGTQGPRLLIAGLPSSGKTSVARTLAAYATRMGAQPLVVNMDPKEGMLTLPGTLSASVFPTVMDIETVDGWGSAPSSGPSPVPVKLPFAMFYGHKSPEDDVALYRELTSAMANVVTARSSKHPEVRHSGLIVDTTGVSAQSKAGLELLGHIVEELSVNIIVVLGSSRINAELTKRFGKETTSLGEPIHVVQLDKSEGVVDRDEQWLQQTRDAAIKEYFFGDPKTTLSPFTHTLDFEDLVIYKAPEYSIYGDDEQVLVRVDPSPMLEHWTLAIMQAAVQDPPEVIRAAAVLGYVYVAQVFKDKPKIRILAPVSGRLGDRPLIWGKWPEPYINLLG